MDALTYMWDWIYRSVSNAVQTLTRIYQNSTMAPAFDLFLVVLSIGVVLKFIVLPLFGLSLSSGSDQVKKNAKETKDFVQNTHDVGDYF